MRDMTAHPLRQTTREILREARRIIERTQVIQLRGLRTKYELRRDER